jgi:uncharacterized membrane protein YcaP (DUF421 family)
VDQQSYRFPDWSRLLVGTAPWTFLIEVTLRTLLVYTCLLVVVRLMGKRMSAQSSVAEIVVMLVLGAIVAVPMQEPERGILPGLVVLGATLGLQALVGRWSFVSERFSALVHGTPSILLRDGVLDLAAMKRALISREQLYAKLRGAEVRHLGELTRVYLEASGAFSVLKKPVPRPGISVFPAQDRKVHDMESYAEDQCGCVRCGTIAPRNDANGRCPKCGGSEWARCVDVDGAGPHDPNEDGDAGSTKRTENSEARA